MKKTSPSSTKKLKINVWNLDLGDKMAELFFSKKKLVCSELVFFFSITTKICTKESFSIWLKSDLKKKSLWSTKKSEKQGFEVSIRVKKVKTNFFQKRHASGYCQKMYKKCLRAGKHKIWKTSRWSTKRKKKRLMHWFRWKKAK